MPTNPIPTTPNLGAYWKSDAGLWQDAAGTVPAAANGDPVGLWQDQSGNGYHMSQATAGNRPTLNPASSYKGQPSVSFLQSSAQFLSNAAFNLTSNPAAGTWVIVFTSGASAFGTQPLFGRPNGVLCYLDDASASTFYHHSGNVEYCSIPFGRANTGKLFFGQYNASGATNADKLRQRMNTFPRAVTYSATIGGQGAGYVVGPGMNMGKHYTGAQYLNGQVFEAAYFTRDLTLSEVQSIEAYAAQRYFLQGLSNAHCFGDSITKGYPDNQSNGLDWPTLMAGQLGAGWTTENHGITAYKTAQIELSAGVADQDRNEWRRRDVVIHFSGTNDLAANGTAAQAVADMTTSVANRHAVGFPLVGVVTITPRQDYPGDFSNGATVASFETQRAAYNSSLLSGATGADFVIDLTGDARFNDCTNTTYFNADTCHWKANLNGIFAGIAAAKLLTLPALWPTGAFRRAGFGGGFRSLDGGFN